MQGKPEAARQRADEKAQELWLALTVADLIPTQNRTETLRRLSIALDDFSGAETHGLHLRLEAYEAALREIASKWTEKQEAKLAEWEGAGTEALEDIVYVDAVAMQPLCEIARKALETP